MLGQHRLSILPFLLLTSCVTTSSAASSSPASLRQRTASNCGTIEENHIGHSVPLTKVIYIDEALEEAALLNIIAGAEDKFPGLPVFVYFSAEKCNGVSWCGDSNRAEPIVVSALEQNRPRSVLIVCSIQKSAYRGEEYPYSVSTAIGLKTVPTLQR